jgi:hypothetical protein
VDKVDQTAFVLDTLRGSDEVHRDANLHLAVRVEAHKVDMPQPFVDRVALDLTNHDVAAVVGALHRERKDRVSTAPGAKQILDPAWVDADRKGIQTEPVDVGRDAARSAQPAVGALAQIFSCLNF